MKRDFSRSVTVHATGYERREKLIEIDLRLPHDISPAELRLLELDASGQILDDSVPFQFDAEMDGRNRLIFVLRGTTPAEGTRHFRIDAEGPVTIAPQIVLKETEDEEQESFEIATQTATYFYHMRGAGFSSLIDLEGNDWINYHPWGGSDGKYRGIPNLVHPEGYFHPGGTECISYVLHRGPLKMAIASQSNDGNWACRWDIYPRYARLTVLQVDHPYWFLYEGTPGGRLDERNDYIVRSTGERTPASERWEGDIPDPEWLYFGSGDADRVLYLIHHEDDDGTDSYWPMEGNMTVFGFGRLGLDKFLERVPAHFTIGFAEENDFETVSRIIDSAYRPLTVEVE